MKRVAKAVGVGAAVALEKTQLERGATREVRRAGALGASAGRCRAAIGAGRVRAVPAIAWLDGKDGGEGEEENEGLHNFSTLHAVVTSVVQM